MKYRKIGFALAILAGVGIPLLAVRLRQDANDKREAEKWQSSGIVIERQEEGYREFATQWTALEIDIEWMAALSDDPSKPGLTLTLRRVAPFSWKVLARPLVIAIESRKYPFAWVTTEPKQIDGWWVVSATGPRSVLAAINDVKKGVMIETGSEIRSVSVQALNNCRELERRARKVKP